MMSVESESNPCTIRPLLKLAYKDFSDLWLHDESHNPTGTHKDRFAWEAVNLYRKMLAQSKTTFSLSLLSSGSAATAVQNLLNRFQLPPLKVLVDIHLKDNIRQSLIRQGCEVFTRDLSQRALSSKDILHLTKNEGGIDLTFSSADSPFSALRQTCYAGLAQSILMHNPDYCLLPFGSGRLLVNMLAAQQSACIFLGATCMPDAKDTIMDKLYAPFHNYQSFRFDEWRPSCHLQSKILPVTENAAQAACVLATQCGIGHEPSGVAGLALLLQLEDQLPRDKKIIVTNTGKLKLSAM